MSAAEVAFRIIRAIHILIERLTLSIHRWPVATFRSQSASIEVIPPEVEHKPYLSIADKILEGHLSVFEHTSTEYGACPDWNKEPSSGCIGPLRFGKTIDVRDKSLVGDIKYLWEPNRHYHLVALAQAYALSKRKTYLLRIVEHIESWIKQCPYGLGPNWSSSLEAGIRLINWWLVWRLIGELDSPAFSGDTGRKFKDLWLKSIYQHVHFINSHYSRYSSGNNHLIGESAAVVIAASAWPFWKRFQEFGSKGKAILEEECQIQNHIDGVNKEQAIWYQQFVLNFFILAGTCRPHSRDSFSGKYWDRIESMIEFLAAMIDENGNIPMFGDSDDGVVYSLSHCRNFSPIAALLQSGSFLYQRLDFNPPNGSGVGDDMNWLKAICDAYEPVRNYIGEKKPIPLSFSHGGYHVFESGHGITPNARLIVKASPLGLGSIAAHAHADSLSVYLTIAGHEFLIDPGTYTYHSSTKWRNYFRGTSAHNTVRIDLLDQSTAGGNFMWTDHAQTECELIERGNDFDRLIAKHDGYGRLPSPVSHRRTVQHFKKDKRILITDQLIGSTTHSIEIFFHFAEDCVVLEGEKEWIITSDRISARFIFDELLDTVSVHKGDSATPLGWTSRKFGSKTPSSTIVCKSAAILPATFVTRIEY